MYLCNFTINVLCTYLLLYEQCFRILAAFSTYSTFQASNSSKLAVHDMDMLGIYIYIYIYIDRYIDIYIYIYTYIQIC